MKPNNYSAALKCFDLGYIYSCLRNYDEAIIHYTKAIEFNPDYIEAYRERGHAYFIQGYEKEARVDLFKAAALNLNINFAGMNEQTNK
jgi:tetratricopeptide (TPR) repeat protein